jgi:hypothetical protein
VHKTALKVSLHKGYAIIIKLARNIFYFLLRSCTLEKNPQEVSIYNYTKRTISLKVDPLIHSALKYYCMDQEKTIQQVVETILQAFIKQTGLMEKYGTVKKKVTKKKRSV